MILSGIIFDMEKHTEERQRCLDLINSPKKPGVALDIVLESHLDKMKDQATYHKNEAEVSDKLATSLDVKLKKTHQDLERRLVVII